MAVAPHTRLLSRATSLRPTSLLLPLLARVALLVFASVAHAAVISATLAFAALHSLVEDAPGIRMNFQQVDAPGLGLFGYVKTACRDAAACHGMTLAATLLSLGRLLCGTSRHILPDGKPSVPTADALAQPSRLKRVALWVSEAWMSYHNEHTGARQLLEVALQTFQANKMSSLVATVWLNRLLAVVIVANCWCSPLIFFTMKRQAPFKLRVARLAVDTVLDVVHSVGIPVAILGPYYRAYDPGFGAFPHALYETDTWVAIVTAEMRQVFVSSWLDLLSKASPWFFLCYRLWLIRGLVASATQPNDKPGHRSRLAQALQVALVLWGAAVLTLHLRVSWVANHVSVEGCLVEVRQWLASSHTCTVAEISCTQRGIAGRPEEIARALQQLNLDRVHALVVSHCPAFGMPPTIKSMSDLTQLKFYNTSILEWRGDTAVTSRTNPNLHYLFMIRTNFSGFPDGLLDRDFPSELRDVKFVATNLATLPASLDQAWRNVLFFVMEANALLRDVPETLARFPSLIFVSLSSNDIREIPPWLLTKASIYDAWLNDNPVVSLPVDLRAEHAIHRLSVISVCRALTVVSVSRRPGNAGISWRGFLGSHNW